MSHSGSRDGVVIALVLIVLTIGAAGVQAVPITHELTLSFSRITSNSPTDVASFISVDIYSIPSQVNRVLFDWKLDTTAPAGSFLSDIYYLSM